MRRVTKRVSEYLPGMTWMNTLISDAQTDDDPTATTENDDQPPVKKLCTSNNTFTNTKYQTTNSTDNHRSSSKLWSIMLILWYLVSTFFNSCTCKFVDVNVLLPEISAVTCIPSTSKQSPKFTSLSNASLQSHDIGNRSKCECKTLFFKVALQKYYTIMNSV